MKKYYGQSDPIPYDKLKECLQAGSIVKKGDLICTYSPYKFLDIYSVCRSIAIQMFGSREETVEESVEETVKAPCDGVVYFIEDHRPGVVEGKKDEYITIYVASYFDDYSELSNWHKTVSGASASENRKVKEGQQ